jgi:hypothetical protein
MSEQEQKGPEHDLFKDNDSLGSESLTDPATDTAKEGEQKQKPDLGSLNRAKQVNVWAERIEKGEASFDSIPEDQEWLKSLVEDEVKERAKRSDIDSIVRQRLEEERKAEARKAQSQKYEALKKDLQTADLTDSDKQLIAAKYDSLKAKGLSNADALEEALDVYKVISKSGEDALSQMKEDMQIPLYTAPVEDKEPEYGTEDFFQKGDAQDRVERMEQIAMGQ